MQWRGDANRRANAAMDALLARLGMMEVAARV
jgi:hypothetical protein